MTDCLDEDGCPPDDQGTPLRSWAPPLLQAYAQFAIEEEDPSLFVLLVAREWTPFCPAVPPSVVASIDGLILERAEWEVLFGCPELAWRLGPDEWPAVHADESTVEVTDGETSFVLQVPFSLTEPPAWALDDVDLQPGTTVELAPVRPVSGSLQVEGVALRFADVAFGLEFDLDEGALRVDIRADVPSGPATLVVRFYGYSDVLCDGTEYCEGSVFGEQRLEVEVGAR